MSFLKFKKNREKYEVNSFYSQNSKAHYHNYIDNDPHKLAQVLIDLYLEGYPIEKAVEIMMKRIAKKDWLGL